MRVAYSTVDWPRRKPTCSDGTSWKESADYKIHAEACAAFLDLTTYEVTLPVIPQAAGAPAVGALHLRAPSFRVKIFFRDQLNKLYEKFKSLTVAVILRGAANLLATLLDLTTACETVWHRGLLCKVLQLNYNTVKLYGM